MSAEDYLADIAPGCPMCGTTEARQANRELRARDLQRQVSRLGERLEELEASAEAVNRFRTRVNEMCGACQMLMTGISAPTDAAELGERIRSRIADLNEEITELSQAA